MATGIITKAYQTELLNASKVTLAAAPLTNAILAEYANSVVLTENTLLSDLQLCTFDGYEPGTIASWRGPYTDLVNEVVISSSVPIAFSCTGTVSVNTVYGHALLDSTGATLLAAQSLDTTITPVPGQSWQVTPEVQLSGSLNACLC